MFVHFVGPKNYKFVEKTLFYLMKFLSEHKKISSSRNSKIRLIFFAVIIPIQTYLLKKISYSSKKLRNTKKTKFVRRNLESFIKIFFKEGKSSLKILSLKSKKFKKKNSLGLLKWFEKRSYHFYKILSRGKNLKRLTRNHWKN